MTTDHTLNRKGHVSHCKRCLLGLPSSQVEVDSSRIALVFYCLGTLDILNAMESQTGNTDRDMWKNWLWEQQISGAYGTGFRPSAFTTLERPGPSDHDVPHLVMTYTALLCLAILRDDFSKLDRVGILSFVRACQQEDGSFSDMPSGGEADLRQLYCAFVISSLLDDWSGIDVDRAIAYIQSCYTYEGGFGQRPSGEALGGTSYCAIAALHLAPDTSLSPRSTRLAGSRRDRTIRWLLQTQTESGGFCGRTGKLADACYCFWCGAALSILGAGDLVNERALANFLGECQFKHGGIAKVPGEHPDPYHTYLSLAVLSILPSGHGDGDSSWKIAPLNALWNASEATSQWAQEHISTKHNTLA